MPGYRASFWVIPDAGVAAVLLTNADSGNSLLRPFMSRVLKVIYDGNPKATAFVAATAAAIRANAAKERERLILPPDTHTVAGLAPTYASSELGRVNVVKVDGGTTLLVTIDPSINGFPFVVGTSGSKRTLTLRDSQHEYVFKPQDRVSME